MFSKSVRDFLRGDTAAERFMALGVHSGTTAQRPVGAPVGYPYWDTSLNKPIWLKTAPSTWADATGLTV